MRRSRFGQGVAKDYAKSFEFLMRAALLQDPEAEFQVSKAYARGWGIPQDDTKADEWRRKAATHGDGAALLQLGLQEFIQITPASDFGHIANLLKGGLAQEGRLLLQSKEEPARSSTARALGQAKLFLGAQTLAGLGVPRNEALGRALVSEALVQMSDVLPPKTAELARNAAKPDQVVTIIGMSLLGDHGRVVTRDSFPLLYVAAMAGNADAQFAISIAYRHGQAVGRSDTEANLWMRKAADSGSIKACVELAYDLWKGTEGQTVDLSSAAHFTIIAANGRGSKG